MVSYLHGRSAREWLDLGTDVRVLLTSIWESMDGPSEVDLGVDLGSIRGMFWDHLGSISGSFWVHAEICQRFWPQTPSGPDF